MADRNCVPAIALAFVLIAGAAASCGGSTPAPTPTAPTPIETTPPPQPAPPAPPAAPEPWPRTGAGLRISGFESYPYFVTGGVQLHLKAIEVDDAGRDVADCGTGADWSTSSRDYASFNALTKNQVLFHGSGARASAEVTITARCNGKTATLTVPMRTYRVSGSVRTPGGAPVAGVLVTELYSKTAVTTDAAGNYETDLVTTPPQITISRPGYETYATNAAWNAQPAVRMDVTLPALPAMVATGSGKVCNLRPADARYAAECLGAGAVDRQTHTFTLDRPGDVRLMTYWPNPPGGSGIDDNLIVRFECDGVRVYEGEIYGTQGGGFTRAARSGTCVITFTNITLLRVLPYEFTVDLR